MTIFPTLLRRSLVLGKTKLMAPPRAITAARLGGSVRTNMYSPMSSYDYDIDPEAIFDEIDTNGDGVISKEQFVEALNRLNYSDLLRIHKAANANMEEKLKTITEIEKNMEALAEANAKKQQAYSNVGNMTGTEIDALFDVSKLKKKEIHTLLGDLRDLINKTMSL
jgi:aryl-alcohol dehydrogenase-like predicted oxidoreductase